MPASQQEPGHAMAVGDPGRAAVGRAVFAALLLGAVFSVLTGPVKQVATLYDHAPWLNDPFDTVVSFAMFFVPITAACSAARVPLCRRSEPLPVARVRDLLRGCQVVLGVVALTVLTEWAGVAIGANRAQWDWATWLQVGILALITVLTVRAFVRLRQVPALPRSAGQASAGQASADPGQAPDWLTDVLALAARQSRWLGPLRRPVLGALNWTDRNVLTVVRRHPVWAAAVAAAAFGVAVGGLQAISEGYIALATVLVIFLLGCGMFAFLVGAGGYLGLVRGSAALQGARRRALDAGALTCVGLLAVLAFRNSLWWIVGSSAAAAGIGQAYALLGIAGLALFTVLFSFETLVRSHQLGQKRT